MIQNHGNGTKLTRKSKGMSLQDYGQDYNTVTDLTIGSSYYASNTVTNGGSASTFTLSSLTN